MVGGKVSSIGARRLCASSLDIAIFVSGHTVFLVLAFGLLSDDDLARTVLVLWFLASTTALLTPVSCCLYFIVFHARRGYTPGKRMLGLRLVSHQTGLLPSVPAIVVRQLVAVAALVLGPALLRVLPWGAPHLLLDVVSVWVPFVAPMLLHPEGRGWHDLIAGTVVVRAEGHGAAAGAPGNVTGW